MSERVNRFVLTRQQCGNNDDILFEKLYKQIRLLIESGYNVFVSDLDSNIGKVSIEFCLADPEMKQEDIPQPCWLYPNELEQLSYFQLENALNEAKEAVGLMERELTESKEEESSDKKTSSRYRLPKKKKDDGGDA